MYYCRRRSPEELLPSGQGSAELSSSLGTGRLSLHFKTSLKFGAFFEQCWEGGAASSCFALFLGDLRLHRDSSRLEVYDFIHLTSPGPL